MMQVMAREVAWLFLKEVMRLHGVPESILSDCNTKFMSMFWHKLHKLMGTKLLMFTALASTNGWCNRAGKPLYMTNSEDDHQ